MRVDFHSHILPGIDDGSHSVEESLEMLKELKNQGIDTVVATPHFYIEQNEVKDFVRRRDESYRLLMSHIKEEDNLPKIILGAEVLFYNQLYMLDDIEKLCIGDTDYILIEMPFTPWDKSVFEKLFRMVRDNGIIPVIAHIDRYYNKNNKKYFKLFGETESVIQINAEAFRGSFFEKKRSLKYIKKGFVSLVGSDCHNMTSRPPDSGKAYRIIEKKLGHSAVSYIDRVAEDILGGR